MNRVVERNEKYNYDLYFSPIIIRVIKSRSVCWAEHVARMGERRDEYRVLLRKPEGKKNLEYLGVDGRIILKWMFKKWDVGGMDWIDLALDRNRLRAVVNAVVILRVPSNAENFLTS